MTQIVNYPVIDLILIAYNYKNVCDALDNASKACIPSSKVDYYKEHIVPGFNEHVKELHTFARHDYITWKTADKPRFGEICFFNESIQIEV